MYLLLTSSPGADKVENGERFPQAMDNENGFVDRLREHWDKTGKVLLIASNPTWTDINDHMARLFEESFVLSGLDRVKVEVCDDRNLSGLAHLQDYFFLVLSGGHVPTQNAFFHRIGLQEKIKNYDGMVMGISAGTMNCADVVYVLPEEEGEAADPHFARFAEGLGLTGLQIIPHFAYTRTLSVDGRRILEDIAVPDSLGRKFLCLYDGSYVESCNGKETLYGEYCWIENGRLLARAQKDE